ncbi:MAG: hypothetical protein ACYDGN_07930 [Acidimicrobiales bacterium]
MPQGPLRDRLRQRILKPADGAGPGSSSGTAATLTTEELAAAVRSADDKERLIGLIAAPLAAAIGILVMTALIDGDPPARLRGGGLNKLHVSLSLYHDLLLVLLGISIVMLVAALFRKRLLLGILMALFGLAVFNLHYWGFGVPFILGGAWLLVRAYRLQRDLHEAKPETLAATNGSAGTARSRPNKRYTPPAPSRRK